MADILAVKNIPHEGLGLFEDVLDECHWTVDIVEHPQDFRGSLPYPDEYSAMIVFGGPASANDATPGMNEEKAMVYNALRTWGVPYLGICLGHQVAAVELDGRVEDSDKPEVGFEDENGQPYTLTLTEEGRTDPLLKNIPLSFRTFQLHSQEVTELPEGAEVLATGDNTHIQIVRFGELAYGIQAHPELTESMLLEWIKQVPELAAIGQDRLIDTYRTMRSEYRHIGRTIMLNFLKILEAEI